MQNAPRDHSEILLTFIKLPYVIKIFVLPIYEWPLKTGFTVVLYFVDFTDKPSNASKTDTDPQDQQRRSAIQDTIVNKGGLTFQDIAGLHEAKQALTEAIIMPLHFPQLFTGTPSNRDQILDF